MSQYFQNNQDLEDFNIMKNDSIEKQLEQYQQELCLLYQQNTIYSEQQHFFDHENQMNLYEQDDSTSLFQSTNIKQQNQWDQQFQNYFQQKKNYEMSLQQQQQQQQYELVVLQQQEQQQTPSQNSNVEQIQHQECYQSENLIMNKLEQTQNNKQNQDDSISRNLFSNQSIASYSLQQQQQQQPPSQTNSQRQQKKQKQLRVQKPSPILNQQQQWQEQQNRAAQQAAKKENQKNKARKNCFRDYIKPFILSKYHKRYIDYFQKQGIEKKLFYQFCSHYFKNDDINKSSFESLFQIKPDEPFYKESQFFLQLIINYNYHVIIMINSKRSKKIDQKKLQLEWFFELINSIEFSL